jgi:hypothetical protein
MERDPIVERVEVPERVSSHALAMRRALVNNLKKKSCCVRKNKNQGRVTAHALAMRRALINQLTDVSVALRESTFFFYYYFFFHFFCPASAHSKA